MSRPVLIAVIGFATAATALISAALLDSDEDRRAAPPSSLPSMREPAQPAASGPVPAFDVVRIGERGDAVLAGRAMPKAEVVVLDGPHELGRAVADDRGEWVLVPTLPMAPGARALAIEAVNPDGAKVRSGAPVILVVPEGAAEPALAVAPLAAGGPRLMLGPPGEAGPVTIDLVDRDETGRLFIGGRAQPGATLHLYRDDKFLGRVRADAEGGWRLAAEAGSGQSLRADLVDDKGKVRFRVEVPMAAAPTVAMEGVVVEPGASLWTIARRLYGSGEASTVIYRANKDRIRDPDRIYPGQVFQVPRN